MSSTNWPCIPGPCGTNWIISFYPFSYTMSSRFPARRSALPAVIGFCHDMGTRINFSNREKGAAYKTLDDPGRTAKLDPLRARFTGRPPATTRGLSGTRTYSNARFNPCSCGTISIPPSATALPPTSPMSGQRSGEITTYDAMDASLQHPIDSLYIAGKSFACYTMLEPVFAAAWRARAGAAGAKRRRRTRPRASLSHWDPATKSCFPALFDGESTSSIIPAVEGLSYLYAMGLTDEIALDGPNADLSAS